MSKPKMTDDQAAELEWYYDQHGSLDELNDWVETRMAEAGQTARAEAWDEGWKAGQCSGFRFTPPNPYRSTP